MPERELIVVTGASSGVGKHVVSEQLEAGHTVIGLDVVGSRGPDFVQVDLTDYGQVIDALGGVDRTERFDAVGRPAYSARRLGGVEAGPLADPADRRARRPR